MQTLPRYSTTRTVFCRSRRRLFSWLKSEFNQNSSLFLRPFLCRLVSIRLTYRLTLPLITRPVFWSPSRPSTKQLSRAPPPPIPLKKPVRDSIPVQCVLPRLTKVMTDCRSRKNGHMFHEKTCSLIWLVDREGGRTEKRERGSVPTNQPT